MNHILTLRCRSQQLVQDDWGGFSVNAWKVRTRTRKVPADRAAILICDMWDQHWSRAAAARVEQMAPRMNAVVRSARNKGVSIIHAPSDTITFYAETPARRRMLAVPGIEPPPAAEHTDPPKPVDDKDNSSDSNHGDEDSNNWCWTRQHAAIEIDQDRDVISADGREVYSFLKARGIQAYLIMGVHTGMCILHRTFGIKQMVRWGVQTLLVRDLTDAMYDPACSPYVSHDEGTELLVRFIEKFWCPTIASADLA